MWFRKKRDGANVFFLSIAYSVRRGPLNGFFLTGRPLPVGRGSSLLKERQIIGIQAYRIGNTGSRMPGKGGFCLL